MSRYLKDFLFFSKKDKNAIIILLGLICAMALISTYVKHIYSVESPNTEQNQEQLRFVNYKKLLDDKTIVGNLDNTQDQKKGIIAVGSAKINNTTTSKLRKGQVINLNNASAGTLQKLPGIGETLAQRIMDYRISIGKFENTDQLLQVKGLTNKKISNILPFIILGDEESN